MDRALTVDQSTPHLMYGPKKHSRALQCQSLFTFLFLSTLLLPAHPGVPAPNTFSSRLHSCSSVLLPVLFI